MSEMLSPARLLAVMRANRGEILIWAGVLVVYIIVVAAFTLWLHSAPAPREAAAAAYAFRRDYLSPWNLFSAGVLAPLIETWLIVKGVDALHDKGWRGLHMLLAVALVAAVMHYFARGGFSALYNACFFALMARIYLKSAYTEAMYGENRAATIALLIAMHMLNNAVALGMIGVYARAP
jgi:hypothetical protein